MYMIIDMYVGHQHQGRYIRLSLHIEHCRKMTRTCAGAGGGGGGTGSTGTGTVPALVWVYKARRVVSLSRAQTHTQYTH